MIATNRSALRLSLMFKTGWWPSMNCCVRSLSSYLVLTTRTSFYYSLTKNGLFRSSTSCTNSKTKFLAKQSIARLSCRLSFTLASKLIRPKNNESLANKQDQLVRVFVNDELGKASESLGILLVKCHSPNNSIIKVSYFFCSCFHMLYF